MNKVLTLIFWFELILTEFGISQNNTIRGIMTTPSPTLIKPGIEWVKLGDNNLKGVVIMQYSKRNKTDWQQGMPLFREPAGHSIAFSWQNKHSWSIFDLKSCTGY